jgi:hypothetical protein
MGDKSGKKDKEKAKSSKCRNRSKRNNGSRTRTCTDFVGCGRSRPPRAFVLGSTPALSDVANPPLRTCPRQSGRQIRVARVGGALGYGERQPRILRRAPAVTLSDRVVAWPWAARPSWRPCGVHTSASPGSLEASRSCARGARRLAAFASCAQFRCAVSRLPVAVRSIEVRRMDGQRFVVKVKAAIDERIAALTRRTVVAVHVRDGVIDRRFDLQQFGEIDGAPVCSGGGEKCAMRPLP